MKKSKFTESQIVAILKQADSGMKAEQLCRQHGMNQPLTTTGKANTAAWKPLMLSA